MAHEFGIKFTADGEECRSRYTLYGGDGNDNVSNV